MTNRPDDQPDMDAETVYDAGPNVTPPTPDAVDHYLREIGRVPLLLARDWACATMVMLVFQCWKAMNGNRKSKIYNPKWYNSGPFVP
jgi:hypothetical protein